MSSASFYRSVLARDLSPEATAMPQSLLVRAERIDALAEALPDQVLANRTRREGKPVTLTKSARRTVRGFAQDAREAATRFTALVAQVCSEIPLIRFALAIERTELMMDQTIYSAGHPEDVALAQPLLELRAENIAEPESFLAATTSPEAKPQGDA